MSRIAELVVADEPARWRALGFAVDDGGTPFPTQGTRVVTAT